jgi:hypothetical protein
VGTSDVTVVGSNVTAVNLRIRESDAAAVAYDLTVEHRLVHIAHVCLPLVAEFRNICKVVFQQYTLHLVRFRRQTPIAYNCNNVLTTKNVSTYCTIPGVALRA